MGREVDLILATQKGSISLIKRLLGASKKGVFRNKVSPNYQDSRGYTPLHHAIMYGQRESLLVLLRYGADPRISDRSGNYPLHTACQHGDYDSLQLLIEHSPIKPDIDQQNANDDTPLIITAQEGFYTLVEFLLRAGADPHITNQLDQNCLELASYYGRTDVVSLLLRKVAGILDSPHSAKHTSLHFAARNGHIPILQLLLDKGTDINTTCKTGSCLHEAALHGRIETVAYLLDRDIDVYLINILGQTVLEAIQSLAASQCRSRIQQLISDHICLKLKFGNKRNSQSFHNGLTSFKDGTKDDNANFQRSSSFNVDFAQNRGWSVSNILTECETDNSSYSAPYHKTRDPPKSDQHKDRQVYTNEAVMYNKRLRGSLDANLHFDDEITHASLSLIRKPKSNLPVSLQGNGIYYYKTPSAKFRSPHSDNRMPPLEHIKQQFMNERAESSSSGDFVRQHGRFPDLYNYSGEMAPIWFPYAEVVTGESDMDEMSLEGSSQSSYTQLHVKRSAPVVQLNPAHSLYSHLISYADDNDEDECITQQVNSRNPDDPLIGLPTDGTYIPLQDRPASVLGCSERIERKEFVKKFARHPLANLEDSTSRIAMISGDRVSFYPFARPEAAYTPISSEKGEDESDSCHTSFNPIMNNPLSTDRHIPPPVPTRRQSLMGNHTREPNPTPRPKASLPEPLIPQPFIIRQKKTPTPRAREDNNPYLEPNTEVCRRPIAIRPKRRVNTYHEGDCDLTPAKYPYDVEPPPPERLEAPPRTKAGLKLLEKPPPGKPRGSKGYHSGAVTSDTSRSTSPSFSDSQSRSFSSQEKTPYKEPTPINSPPFFASEAFTSYRIPVVEPSNSGEDTPQFSDQDSQHVISPDKFKMSLQVDNSRLNSQLIDKNKTLTRDDPSPERDDTEWESIDNVMDMVAQISNEMESSTSTELNNSLSPISVPDLMQSIRLPHRASLLLTNGFDNIDFMAGILTQDELEEIGIEDIAEIQHILAAVNLLPAPLINLRPSSLSQWLKQIGLHQLYHLFTSKGYNTIDDVCHLWDIHLASVLEIHQLGYRKRILYSLSQIRAASPERNYTPSESVFSAPLYQNTFFPDKSSPMNSPASVPPPPPRRDSFMAAQEFWSFYEKNSANSYPRDSSHAQYKMNGDQQHDTSHSKLKYSSTLPPPPLPPKLIGSNPAHPSEKPQTLPKPILGNNAAMKYSNSFCNSSRYPATDRMASSGEKLPYNKSSFSVIEVDLKNTVDQMSTSSKETLISYISNSLQPPMMSQSNSNDNRSNTALPHGRVSQASNTSMPASKLRKDSSSHPKTGHFVISPLYQQRAEETGETLPPEMRPNRTNKHYHSIVTHSAPTQLRNGAKNQEHPDDNLTKYYPDQPDKFFSKNNKPEKKKHKFGKFRSSKKIIKQNPVYQSSGVLQGLPTNVQNNPQAPPSNRVSESEPSVSNSPSISPTSNGASYPASDIRIRSPMVMRRETMSPNLEITEMSQTDVQNLWLHPVNTLTTGCVNYTVKYLGSAVVSALVGKETINNTCRKIKEVTKRSKKIPLITLSISWKWIRLSENKKEQIIQEHMMHHISYSSQYMDDLRMFAFISRDKKTPKYYCNVFQSPTIDHADEVVHTLGQAFEISYQQLMNVKKSQEHDKDNIKLSNKTKKLAVTQSSPPKFHRSQSVDDVI